MKNVRKSMNNVKILRILRIISNFEDFFLKKNSHNFYQFYVKNSIYKLFIGIEWRR